PGAGLVGDCFRSTNKNGMYRNHSDFRQMPKSVWIMEEITLWIHFICFQMEPKECARLAKAERFAGTQLPRLDQSPIVKFIDQVRRYLDLESALYRGIS